jgi:hypothetical protein
MKKLFVLLLVAGYCIAGIADEPMGSWIMAKSGRIDMKKISFGVSHARIILQNGNTLKLPLSELSSYSIDGRLFNKMPVYKFGKPSGEMAFMELIGKKGDLNLYRYESFNYESINPREPVANFAIYSGDKLYLALTEKTLENVCKYFGLQLAYK